MDRVTKRTRRAHRADARESPAANPDDDQGADPASAEGPLLAQEPTDSAGPLRASWRPVNDTAERRQKSSGSRIRRTWRSYGWRVVAAPVLLVLTVLVVLDTMQDSAASDDDSNARAADTPTSTPESPAASENLAGPADLDIPTAELPSGGSYTEAGEETWHTVPGEGEQVGEGGELYTYTVEVEDGIDPTDYAGDDGFAEAVETALSDPRGWTWDGDVSLQRVDADTPDPDFRVSLTTPDTVRQPHVCGGTIPFDTSCRRSELEGEDRVVINLARWVRGALAFKGDMTSYRQYLVNHEVGHALELGHVGCQEDGDLAPVMMQQTFGVSNDYIAELNDLPGGDQGAVPADGKTCKPNAWPNPQAGSE